MQMSQHRFSMLNYIKAQLLLVEPGAHHGGTLCSPYVIRTCCTLDISVHTHTCSTLTHTHTHTEMVLEDGAL